MMKKAMPSAWWYGVSVLMAVTGAIGVIVYGIFLIFSIEKSAQQFPALGVQSVYLATPGRYVINYEYVSRYENQRFSTDQNAHKDMLFEVISEATNEPVELLPHETGSYNFNDKRIGISLFSAQVGSPGSYRIQTQYPDGRQAPKIILSIMPALISQLMWPILWVSLYTTAICLASAAIFQITFFRRRKWMKSNKTCV